jgi:hypothetical protein
VPRRDRDVEDHLLRLGSRVHRKGIGTHAPSEIVYHLEEEYDRFKALIGGAEARGTVLFRVYADGELAYESEVLRGLGKTREIAIPINGARSLRLVVADAGDGYSCDMANWVDARLHRALQTKASDTR